MAEKFNGWTNYETWAIVLWLDNEEESQRSMRELAQQASRDARYDPSWEASFTHREKARHLLAEAIKSEHEEANPLADQCNVFSDMLGAALEDVAWGEIADHYLDDLKDEDEDEDDSA